MGKWEYWAKYSTSCLWSLIPNSNLTTSLAVSGSEWVDSTVGSISSCLAYPVKCPYSKRYAVHQLLRRVQLNKYKWAWPLHTAMHMFLVQLSEPPAEQAILHSMPYFLGLLRSEFLAISGWCKADSSPIHVPLNPAWSAYFFIRNSVFLSQIHPTFLQTIQNPPEFRQANMPLASSHPCLDTAHS